MAFFNFGNKWQSDGARTGEYVRCQFKATIVDCSHSIDRRVSWSIVLVKENTFTDFSTAFDLNIHSWSHNSAQSCQDWSQKGSDYHVTYSILCASDQHSVVSVPNGRRVFSPPDLS